LNWEVCRKYKQDREMASFCVLEPSLQEAVSRFKVHKLSHGAHEAEDVRRLALEGQGRAAISYFTESELGDSPDGNHFVTS